MWVGWLVPPWVKARDAALAACLMLRANDSVTTDAKPHVSPPAKCSIGP